MLGKGKAGASGRKAGQDEVRSQNHSTCMGCGQKVGPGLSLPSSAGAALAHYEVLSSRPMSS